MKKYVVLIGAFMLFSIQLLAQAPVYLTKSYKPVDSERYTAYPSLEIEGGDIWNNCFVLGVINNYHGRASFSLGSKYETISFIIGPGKSHGKHDPDVVQIHADGKRGFEHVVREADKGQTPHDLRGKNDPQVKSRMLFRDITPYRMNYSSVYKNDDGRHTWVAPDRKTSYIVCYNPLSDEKTDYRLHTALKGGVRIS